jgi:hypothetical protein
MIPSIKEQGRFEALLVFHNTNVARRVLDMNINGIGGNLQLKGFYLEKVQARSHDYLISKKIKTNIFEGFENKPSNHGLLSPVYTDSGSFEFIDEHFAKKCQDTELELENPRLDFDISTKNDMGQQLIGGYAQLLAATFLTIEKIGGFIG